MNAQERQLDDVKVDSELTYDDGYDKGYEVGVEDGKTMVIDAINTVLSTI